MCRPSAMVSLAVIALITSGPPVFARSADRTLPANANGTRFTGDIGPNSHSQLDDKVVVTQGTLKITGAHADVYTDNGGAVSRVVVTGENAHIEQIDDANHLMSADARSIDYSVDKGAAVLTGSARAQKQGGGAITGDRLRYNTGTGTFDVQSTGTSLVHVTFDAKPTGAPSPNPNP